MMQTIKLCRDCRHSVVERSVAICQRAAEAK